MTTACPHPQERWDRVTGFVVCTRCAAELRFQCPWSEPGESRCPEWRCDCFIDTYPDSPLALHPEAFVVRRTVDVDLPPFDPAPVPPPSTKDLSIPPLFDFPDDWDASLGED